MRFRSPNLFKFASLGLVGLAFAHSVSAAVTHTVADASFGSSVAGGGEYSYASTSAWANNNAIDDNWFFNTSYTVNTSPKRPTPRTGDVALHGNNGYTSQILSDTFVAGRTYTFSIYVSGDTDSTGATDRAWFYFFDGTTLPGVFTEGSDLLRARFLRDGTIDSFGGVGTGAFSATNEGWSLGNNASWEIGGGTWGLVTLSYTATAAEDGHPIGIAFWGGPDSAIDDVSVTSVPEPSLAALLALGGGLLLRRRRKF
jgi:hypothetical protein